MTEPGEGHRWRGFGLTVFAMVAFASNSILCRLALRGEEVDAAGFTALRLGSGALVLLPIVLRARSRASVTPSQSIWPSALALFVYAAGFSFAYLMLDAGTGALILFGMVQLTMLLGARLEGQRLTPRQWLGFAVSASGLVAFTLPGVGPAPLSGALLMALAGVAWGIYSLRGRGAKDPRLATANNFVYGAPWALALAAVYHGSLHASPRGVALAVASGALASGGGYIVWYAALRTLRAMEAALVQLTVPVLAAIGGAVVIGEALTARSVIAGAAILVGIGVAIRVPKAPR